MHCQRIMRIVGLSKAAAKWRVGEVARARHMVEDLRI